MPFSGCFASEICSLISTGPAKGRTFDNGFVHMEVQLFTDAAIVAAEQIPTLDVPVDDAAIRGSLVEIIAEKRVRLSRDSTRLRDALRELHAQPRIALDAFGQCDLKLLRRRRKALWITAAAARTRDIRCELTLDKTFARAHRELLPLFHVIGVVLLANLSGYLVEACHYHEYDRESGRGHKPSESRTFRVWQAEGQPLTSAATVCHQAIIDFLARNIVARIVDYLWNCSYQQPFEAPHELQILEAYGILVGGACWRNLATADNVDALLQHCAIQLSSGREKLIIEVSDDPVRS
jgi:hypothetical protein